MVLREDVSLFLTGALLWSRRVLNGVHHFTDIQEIYGSHYELPPLGPLGANGLANARDFEHPVASFDIDQSPWEIVYKVCGELHVCKQEHTPFDVVAWHGK